MSGESGGTCRSNVDGVNNHCDHVAEREVTQPYGYRVVPYRVGTTAYSVMFDIFLNIIFLKNLTKIPEKVDSIPKIVDSSVSKQKSQQNTIFLAQFKKM